MKSVVEFEFQIIACYYSCVGIKEPSKRSRIIFRFVSVPCYLSQIYRVSRISLCFITPEVIGSDSKVSLRSISNLIFHFRISLEFLERILEKNGILMFINRSIIRFRFKNLIRLADSFYRNDESEVIVSGRVGGVASVFEIKTIKPIQKI